MKPLILLVDDNEDILDFIEDELAEKYDVMKAASGEEALHALTGKAVQLVISDVMMPGMDGYALCVHIKSNIDYSHIPVILLTAKNTLQSKIEGLETGADAYIEKPFSPEYLRVQIANLLLNRAKLRSYFASSPLIHIKSIAHSREDEELLEKISSVIITHLEDTEFDVDKLAHYVNLSKPTLYRKIKAIADLTPNELINITRLKKAAELLAENQYKIYEVAYMAGYASQTIFGRNFLKQFGMTPSEYVAKKQD